MTYNSIEERWKQHKRDAHKRNLIENRPLYRAIEKYGIENFSIEEVEETDNPEEREKYWIEYYGSFKNGYNATLGGDGRPYIDYDLVIATYRELKNQRKVAEKLNIHYDTVSYILKAKKEPVLSHLEVSQKATGKIINQYDLNENYIQSFPSVKAAADALGKVTATSKGATSHISDVCRGKRKTAYGYKWKFADEK
jgi:hypothetical protein